MKTIEQNLKVYNRKKRVIKKELETLDKETMLNDLWNILYEYEQNYSSTDSLDLLFTVIKNVDKKNIIKVLADVKARLNK